MNFPTAFAIDDLNNDGRLDIVVPSEGSNQVAILLGDGLGGFTQAPSVPVGSGPTSLAVGDFNGDGKRDFIVVHPGPQSIATYHGDGTGGFTASGYVNSFFTERRGQFFRGCPARC